MGPKRDAVCHCDEQAQGCPAEQGKYSTHLPAKAITARSQEDTRASPQVRTAYGDQQRRVQKPSKRARVRETSRSQQIHTSQHRKRAARTFSRESLRSSSAPRGAHKRLGALRQTKLALINETREERVSQVFVQNCKVSQRAFAQNCKKARPITIS